MFASVKKNGLLCHVIKTSNMILKLKYTKNTEQLPIQQENIVKSYIHKVLGENNKYHNTFSDYAISNIQGGRLTEDKLHLDFPDGGCIIVSSDNQEFLAAILNGIGNVELGYGMKLLPVEFGEFSIGKYVDTVQTITPIRLRTKDRVNILVTDDNFIEYLTMKCKQKLSYCMDAKKVETLQIELLHKERSKVKKVMVGETLNICSMVRLRIKGDKEVRRKLYTLGLGMSTGCCFGSVKVFSEN